MLGTQKDQVLHTGEAWLSLAYESTGGFTSMLTHTAEAPGAVATNASTSQRRSVCTGQVAPGQLCMFLKTPGECLTWVPPHASYILNIINLLRFMLRVPKLLLKVPPESPTTLTIQTSAELSRMFLFCFVSPELSLTRGEKGQDLPKGKILTS